MVRAMIEVPDVMAGSVSKARHSAKLQAAFVRQALKYSEERCVSVCACGVWLCTGACRCMLVACGCVRVQFDFAIAEAVDLHFVSRLVRDLNAVCRPQPLLNDTTKSHKLTTNNTENNNKPW